MRGIVRAGLAVVVIVAGSGSLSAQPTASGSQDRRVTVMTQKGETVEGTFKGATAAEVVIIIAGQEVKLAVEGIKYLSFEGKLDSAATIGGSNPTSAVSDALQALEELDTATEIGVLRDQYSAKLLATLPRVKAFIDAEDGTWLDTKAAMRAAMNFYQWPMSSLGSWQNASSSFSGGSKWVQYAKRLATDSSEQNHKESQEERKIEIPTNVNGRLGSGDVLMPKELDGGTEGLPNDVFVFTLVNERSVNAHVQMDGCGAHVMLLDEAGKKLGDNGGGMLRLPSPEATLSKGLKPGTYRLWVGCFGSFRTGTYTLTVR
jgi:hypothetical protein